MKGTNYKTFFVATVPEAREAMKLIKPKLVVLDRLIEERDCLYYIEELRTLGYAGPVLVVSVVDDAKSALEAGASRFLSKPVAPFTLINVVRELIEGQSSKTILLVDDDEVTRYLLGGELARLGYRIQEAHGGREAMNQIEKEKPDAIILDIAMPDMNGFEVLREIRNTSTLRTLPVIIHSSREFSKQEERTLLESEALLYPKGKSKTEISSRELRQVLEAAGLG
jgi:CheY-like chemotaxis protein